MTSVLEFELRLDETGDHRRGVRLRDELSAAIRDARVVTEVDDVDVAQPPSEHRAADLEIIGLVKNTNAVDLRLPPRSTVYVSYAQLTGDFPTTVSIRVSRSLGETASAIRKWWSTPRISSCAT